MATSRSSEVDRIWTAGASVFSGRVDPSWQVPAEKANGLLRCLEQLPPAGEADAPKPPGLGYRGSWLRAPDGREWRIYGGVVKAIAGAKSTHLRDAGRDCERQLLGTAPKDVLPAGIL
jgi:hypothetical protein